MQGIQYSSDDVIFGTRLTFLKALFYRFRQFPSIFLTETFPERTIFSDTVLKYFIIHIKEIYLVD
jgi:hypothetical protein